MYTCKCHIQDVENGYKTDKVMWKHPGTDVTGMIARSEKVAGITEQVRIVKDGVPLIFGLF